MNDDSTVLELQTIDEAPRKPAGELAIADTSPAGLMLRAMDRGASLEQIEKMMDLMERHEKREAEKAFREAFAAFRGENIIIPKTKHVDRGRGGSFDQAEYDEVCRRLSPALARHGFGFRHDQKFGSRSWTTDGVASDVGWVWVTCYLEHKKGHVESIELEGPPGDLSVNTPTQNMQSTASYLKRQSLLAITGTATGGEDDEAKMRRRDEGSDAGGDPILQAGRDKAMEGATALAAWWDAIGKQERKRLANELPGLRRAAEEADHARG